MFSERQLNNGAWVIAMSIMDVIEPVLRDEEKRDCFLEIISHVKSGISLMVIQHSREETRLCRPSMN